MSEKDQSQEEVGRQEVERAIAELRVALSNMRGGTQECEPFEMRMVESLLALLQGADSVEDVVCARLDALEFEIEECDRGVCYNTGAEIDALHAEYRYLENWLDRQLQ